MNSPTWLLGLHLKIVVGSATLAVTKIKKLCFKSYH